MSDLDTKVAVLETKAEHLTEHQTSTSQALSRLENGVNAIKTRVDQWNGAIPRIADAVEKIEKRDRELTEVFTAHATRLQGLDKLPDKITNLEKFQE